MPLQSFLWALLFRRLTITFYFAEQKRHGDNFHPRRFACGCSDAKGKAAVCLRAHTPHTAAHNTHACSSTFQVDMANRAAEAARKELQSSTHDHADTGRGRNEIEKIGPEWKRRRREGEREGVGGGNRRKRRRGRRRKRKKRPQTVEGQSNIGANTKPRGLVG